MKAEFKADKSKVFQMLIAAPLGTVLGVAFVYFATGSIPLPVVALMLFGLALFIFLGSRLKSTPYLEVDGSQITINNIFTGSKTSFVLSEVKEASVANNVLTLKTAGNEKPTQVALGMLSKPDLEEVRRIFRPINS